jgi:hypothetical protein
MTSIIEIFNSNTFTSFEQVKTFFESEPYFFEVKETGNLFMLCMSDHSDLSLKAAREATGIIFEKNTNKLVHYSFAKAYEGFTSDDVSPTFDQDYFYSENVLSTDSLVIDHYFEGSIIKLYYYDGKWNIGTSRHINGNQNRWSSKSSFEKLFSEAVIKSYNCSFADFKKSLDADYAYTFLFQHPDHTMTLNVATEMCFPLNRVKLDNLEEGNEEQGNLTTSYTKVSDIDTTKCGINENYLVYHVDNQGKIKNRVKLLSSKYLELKKKVGNYPNLGLRYLENLKNLEDKMFLRSQYPHYCGLFSDIEGSFHKTCKKIHSFYIKINIKKEENVKVPDNYVRTIRQMHGQYRRTKLPIQLEDVSDKLLTLSPRILASIIDYIY